MTSSLRRALSALVAVLLLVTALPAFAVSPTGIRLNETRVVVDLAESTTLQLKATVLPTGASQDVVWRSGNTSRATVDANGLVTLKSSGVVRVGARPETLGKWAICTIVVKDSNRPSSMTLSSGNASLSVGSTMTLTATLKPSTAAQDVVYKSSRPTVASVSDAGLITGRRAGTAVIRVTSVRNPSLKKSIRVRVGGSGGNAPSSLSITGAQDSMLLGETAQLTVIPNPITASDSVSWSSSNKTRASVSSTGLVTAKAAGRVVITAKSRLKSSVKATVSIVVGNASIQIESDGDVYLSDGDSTTLNVKVSPASVAEKGVVWKSSDSSVATVTNSGKVTGVDAGTATISATTVLGGISDSVAVHVLSSKRTTDMPEVTTTTAEISANLAKIDAVRLSAYSELESLAAKGDITSSELNVRKNILINGFTMHRFPWMTGRRVAYWNGGSAAYQAGRVYYGVPYTQYKRTYNVAKLISGGFFSKKGSYYYAGSLPDINYPGNDCSSFVSMCNWGMNSSYSFLNSYAIYSSAAYKTVSGGLNSLRPGDILVKQGHVAMFLYYTDSSRDRVVIIETGGGAEPNTVATRVRNKSYYAGNYLARRRNGLA